MTEYILSTTGMLSVVTFYLTYKKGLNTLFDKVCCLYLFFVFIHVIFSIIFLKNFSFKEIEIAGMPLIFGYGPFFYIGLKSLTKKKIETKYAFLNFMPLFVFTLIYVVLMTNADLNAEYFYSFYISECVIVVAILFVYAFWAMQVLRPSDAGEPIGKLTMQFIKTGAFSLVVMGLFFAGAAMSGLILGKNIKGDLIMEVLSSGILVSILLAFIYTVENVTGKQLVVAENFTKIEEEVAVKNIQPQILSNEEVVNDKVSFKPKEETSAPVQKYNKSALSLVVLNDYKEKLGRLIDIEKVYLDNELTLEALARKMKMPMHHLTQLFNVHLGENFNQYINKFRVDYAKSTLEDNEEALSIEQIAFNSGFNSKVSFNRHFKSLTGKTPKEYAQLSKTLKKS